MSFAMMIPDGGGGGGTPVSIDIDQMAALISGLETAERELGSAYGSGTRVLDRLWLDSSGLKPLDENRDWIQGKLPDLRRRLAMARDLSASTPGFPVVVTFNEDLVSTKTPEQSRADARRAAEILRGGGMMLDDAMKAELIQLLREGSTDPYFAHEFASLTTGRDYSMFIRDLTPYGQLRGDLSAEDYEALLDGLAGTISLATHGTGDLAPPAGWQEQLVELMSMPRLHGTGNDAYRQLQEDEAGRPALWLLLARGRWSTPFLQQVTPAIAKPDAQGYLWSMMAQHTAISPDGKPFMDPVVALMGALTQNPEAAHWAFTQGGTTSVPLPLDGPGATGEVNTFLFDILNSHRFEDEENGPSTVMLALRSAVMWNGDQSIIDSATNLKNSMEQQQAVWDAKPWYEKWGHTILDVLGMIPLIGEPADGINAAWYAAEQDWVNAGLSSASLIPFVGWGTGSVKIMRGVGDAAGALRMVDRFGNLLPDTSQIAQVVSRAEHLGNGVYRMPDASALNAALRSNLPNVTYQTESLRLLTGADGAITEVKVWVNGSWETVDMSALGLKLSGYKAGDSAWDLLGLPRGEVIETALAKSEYADWVHVGQQRGGFYPTIDFYQGGTAVSLKTLDTPNAPAAIERNIKELAAMRTTGRTADGLPVDEVELDLRIRVGEENSPAVQKILEWARFWEVDVNVQFY